MLAITLLVHSVYASFGDCVCTCCSYPHPDFDCSPVFQGTNRLDSCSQCTTSFCASRFPMACPAGPGTGGAYGIGGHNAFTCDGADNVVVQDAEYGGGGLGVFGLFVCCVCCFMRCRGRQRRYDSVQGTEAWPSATSYVPMAQSSIPIAPPVPIGQPVPAFEANRYYAHQPVPTWSSRTLVTMVGTTTACLTTTARRNTTANRNTTTSSMQRTLAVGFDREMSHFGTMSNDCMLEQCSVASRQGRA